MYKNNYYNNLKFISALFYTELLDKKDIFEIANCLTNNGCDNKYLIEILLDYNTNNESKIINNFNLFMKENNLFIASKDKAINNLINLIFEEILNKKISFMDGMGFIIKYLIDNSRNKEFVGDYLGLNKIIGIYYTIDDGDVTDKNEIEKILNLGLKMVREYNKDTNKLVITDKNGNIRTFFKPTKGIDYWLNSRKK